MVVLIHVMLAVVAAHGGQLGSKGENCEAIIARATAKAANHHKRLLVKFGASWCGPCLEFEHLATSPQFKSAIGQYFDVLFIDYGEDFIRKERPDYFAKHKDLETPGAKAWTKGHGLNFNMPEIAILDEYGKVVVCSERPYHGAQPWERYWGIPSIDAEIAPALHFFAEGNPAVKSTDLEQLKKVLIRYRHR